MGQNDPTAEPGSGLKATGAVPARSNTTDLILTHNKLLRQDVVDAILADRQAAAQLPPPPRKTNWARAGSIATWIIVALVLGSGLFFRWANLSSIQHFAHDSGRDYYVLLEWARDGKWPLLGPGRITHDFTIGPGWFYTLAPAVFASGFSLAAGAGTVGLLGILGTLLAFFWVKRSSGSALAAIAVATVFAWSAGWVEFQRQCWNPHPLFLGLTGCALLIFEARRHPLVSLALYLMLIMIIPQWHTTGWSLVLTSLPFFAWNLWHGKDRLKATRARARWLWGGLTLVVFLALYFPPVLHEIRGGRNLKLYFKNTLPSRRGVEMERRPVAERAIDAAAGLSRDSGQRTFGWYAKLPSEAKEYHYHAYAHGAIFLLFALALTWRLGAGWRARDDLMSVGFLAALALGFFVLRTAQDRAYLDYFGEAWFGVPVLLAGWSAGTLMTRPKIGPMLNLRWPAGALGLVSTGLLTATAVSQLPTANGIRHGRVWHGQFCERTKQVAADVLQEVGGRPFSLILTEGHGAVPAAHFHTLLWLGDNRPVNPYFGNKIRRRELGEVLILVARGSGTKAPLHAENLIDWLAPPTQSEDALIYRIYPENIPEDSQGLRLDASEGVLTVQPLPSSAPTPPN